MAGNLVILSEDDQARVVADGLLQRSSSLSRGDREKHGAGQDLRAGSNNVLGLIGQMVVSRWGGVDYVSTVNTYRSLPDVNYYGVPLEVKTYSVQSYYLTFRPGDLKDYPLDQIIIQVVPEGEILDLHTHRKWWVEGFAYLRDIVRFDKVDFRNNRPPVWMANAIGSYKGQQICKLHATDILRGMAYALGR